MTECALLPAQELYSVMCDHDFRHRTINTVRRLRGPVDPAVLRRAVADVVTRHQPLRLRWDRVHSPAVQRFAEPADEFDVEVLDGTRFGADLTAAVDEAWRRISAELDVAHDGPLRVLLLTLDDDDHLLAMTEHDVVADAWSSDLLIAEVLAAYAARTAGGAPLPELTSSYAEQVEAQRTRGDTLTDAQLAYWDAAFADDAHLPAEVADRRHQGTLTRLDGALGEPETRALRDFAMKSRATPFAAVLAASALACWQVWDQPRFRFSTALLGRADESAKALVGLFSELADVRFDVDETLSLSEFARDTFRRSRQATAQAAPPYSYVRMLSALVAHGGPGAPAAAEQHRRITTGEGGRALTVGFEFFMPPPAPEPADGPLTVEPVDTMRHSETVRYSAYDLIVAAGVAEGTYLAVFHNPEVVSTRRAEDLRDGILDVLRACVPGQLDLPVKSLRGPAFPTTREEQ
ncbi:MAG: condensation domain-containing protein [Actinocatenispora sp.]